MYFCTYLVNSCSSKCSKTLRSFVFCIDGSASLHDFTLKQPRRNQTCLTWYRIPKSFTHCQNQADPNVQIPKPPSSSRPYLPQMQCRKDQPGLKPTLEPNLKSPLPTLTRLFSQLVTKQKSTHHESNRLSDCPSMFFSSACTEFLHSPQNKPGLL